MEVSADPDSAPAGAENADPGTVGIVEIDVPGDDNPPAGTGRRAGPETAKPEPSPPTGGTVAGAGNGADSEAGRSPRRARAGAPRAPDAGRHRTRPNRSLRRPRAGPPGAGDGTDTEAGRPEPPVPPALRNPDLTGRIVAALEGSDNWSP